MKIAVIGGTGLVGAKLVATLRHRGHDIVVASRQRGVDTLTCAVRVSPAFVQPIAADEVAAALADLAAAAPRNGMIEHAGPEVFHLDETLRHAMAAAGDRRAVIADSRARYFGVELSSDSLTPDEGAILGVTRFDEWLKRHASTLRGEDLSATPSLLHVAACAGQTSVRKLRVHPAHASSFLDR